MKRLYKVTLNGTLIQITELYLEALAFSLNVYKSSNQPITIVVTEDDETIVTYQRTKSDV